MRKLVKTKSIDPNRRTDDEGEDCDIISLDEHARILQLLNEANKRIKILEEENLKLKVDAFVNLIAATGFRDATRETSKQRDDFLNLIPDRVYCALYTLVKVAYHEKVLLEQAEVAQKCSLLNGHVADRLHRRATPSLSDKKSEIIRCCKFIKQEDKILRILLSRFYEAMSKQPLQDKHTILALTFNILGFRAFAPEQGKDIPKGRYIEDNEIEQQIYTRLRSDMMRLLALNENGLLAAENFWLNAVKGKESPLAAQIFTTLMEFFEECIEQDMDEESYSV